MQKLNCFFRKISLKNFLAGVTAPGIILAQKSGIDKWMPDEMTRRSDLSDLVQNILSVMFGAAALVAIFYLIWGGYQYITSGGGEQADTAKKTITNAIIGLVIIIIAYALVRYVWQMVIGDSSEIPSI